MKQQAKVLDRTRESRNSKIANKMYVFENARRIPKIPQPTQPITSNVRLPYLEKKYTTFFFFFKEDSEQILTPV